MKNERRPFILIFRENADSDTVDLLLVDHEKEVATASAQFAKNQSQRLLTAVLGLFKKQEIAIAQITGIVVIQGTQRFTISRLTAVVANALSWSEKIPVVSLTEEQSIDQLWKTIESTPVGETISATYSGEPTMTL
jgi:tRNA A37 threonylcarbamoyladenosine modification protein TsaB